MAEYTNLSFNERLQIFNKVFLLFDECVKIKNPNIAEIFGVIHVYRTAFELAMNILKE